MDTRAVPMHIGAARGLLMSQSRKSSVRIY